MRVRLSVPHRLRPRCFTLSAYIGRRFAAIFAADLFIFTLIYVLVDSLNQVDSFLAHCDDFPSLVAVAFTYYVHEIPGLFCRILGPVVTMASAMFTVTLTARANEFVPILATGTSLRRALMPILLFAVFIAGGSLTIQEVWIPGHRGEIRKAKTFGRGYGEILHAYHFDSRSGLYVTARSYAPGEQVADGVFIRSIGSEGETIYTARRARWDAGREAWILEDGEVQRYGANGLLVPEPAPPAPEDAAAEAAHPSLSQRFDTLEFAGSGMIPQDLEGSESEDQYLSMREIRRKADLSPDPYRWRITYYSRLVDPLNHLVLVLLGVPTLFLRGTRNVFLSALVAVAIATVYFVVHSILVYLGSRQALDPALASWLAPMAFGSLGLTMFWWMRT